MGKLLLKKAGLQDQDIMLTVPIKKRDEILAYELIPLLCD